MCQLHSTPTVPSTLLSSPLVSAFSQCTGLPAHPPAHPSLPSMNKYDIVSKVGEGAYGVVLKCRHKVREGHTHTVGAGGQQARGRNGTRIVDWDGNTGRQQEQEGNRERRQRVYLSLYECPCSDGMFLSSYVSAPPLPPLVRLDLPLRPPVFSSLWCVPSSLLFPPLPLPSSMCMCVCVSLSLTLVGEW